MNEDEWLDFEQRHEYCFLWCAIISDIWNNLKSKLLEQGN